MKFSWSKTVFPIAAIFSFRMLGLFLLIPVFSVYAENLQGATPTLIGFALGGYGLTQGLLQMPFGMLSDTFGRKPVITFGLLLFALGSLLGAMTDSIYGMILARTLQGTGAVGSVLIALLADLTPDEQRTKAMAVIGMTIGISFSLAMVISPALSHYYGLSGIFYLTAFLACSGIILLHLVIPNPVKECFHADSEASLSLLKPVISNRHLQRLNVGIFCQHFILTSTFFAVPILLGHHIKQGHLTQQWHFYLPLMLFSFIVMVPFIVLAEKKKLMKTVFLLAVVFATATQFLLAFTCQDWYSLCLLMFVYFIAFNILEASLPSLISKQANPNTKGTAMGIYSTSQFLGIFVGGSLAGILYQWHSSQSIFMINALIGMIWLSVAVYMKPNVYLSTLILHYSPPIGTSDALIKELLQVKGVKEVVIAQEEQVIYVRIAKDQYQPGSAEQIVSADQNNTGLI
ncbi:MFS transporter [Legionella worsleiensis]|uniref:Major facilitator family transporter transporter n=1 Tax=Legionella worsleiensis TaxID=45076 RepID=A0A0W1AK00_9GAMM|nr:MFS transporter [Legionella worsleiensis]KTD81606.1 major facilitator family transporter transporter [Legionella worsleiensis]STY31985.1 major facilitator family transporter [Legionella worsleiensis]